MVGHIDEFTVGKDDDRNFSEGYKVYLDGYRKDTSAAGRLSSLGLDGYATYLPVHFFFDNEQFARNLGLVWHCRKTHSKKDRCSRCIVVMPE